MAAIGRPDRSKSTATILRHHGYNNNLPKPKVFIYKGHQGKEKAYVDALRKGGYKPSIIEHARAKFALYDLDCFRRRPVLERLHKRGLKIFLYPHAARPMIVWDGPHDLFAGTICSFVIARGHEAVMRAYGYPLPIEVTGWTYCEILPFRPAELVKNILFGPIHPSVNGELMPVDKDLNKRTYERLLKYCKQTGAKLTVRHIQKLAGNGLWPVEGVTYVSGATNLSFAEIDQVDLVVGHQTFAYLAVARGRPTLMMGEDIPPRTILPGGETIYVRSWEKYKDILMYPLDILAGDAGSMIARAAAGDAAAADWRERLIGKQFDAKDFVSKLEKHLQ